MFLIMPWTSIIKKGRDAVEEVEYQNQFSVRFMLESLSRKSQFPPSFTTVKTITIRFQ